MSNGLHSGMKANTALADGAEAVTGLRRSRPTLLRFLVFNFFAGVYPRGIPIYTENLLTAFRHQGIECREFRCPAMCRRWPKALQNLVFIFCEQLVMPLLGLRYSRVIHPYNSVSIVGSVTGKAVLIVHDYISVSRRRKKLLAYYIRLTQRIHALAGRDVVFVSGSTERLGKRARLYPRSRTFLFPNAFFHFERGLRSDPVDPREYVLLCSGWSSNKDLGGALELYRDSGLWRSRPLKILGIAGHEEQVDGFLSQHGELRAQIDVLPRLDEAGVGDAYRSAAWVWVHSKKEGYGRSIAEAKLCGCRIVASDISAFREQKDELTFLYSDGEGFISAWERCEAAPARTAFREPKEHELLAAEIHRYLRTSGFGYQAVRQSWTTSEATNRR